MDLFLLRQKQFWNCKIFTTWKDSVSLQQPTVGDKLLQIKHWNNQPWHTTSVTQHCSKACWRAKRSITVPCCWAHSRPQPPHAPACQRDSAACGSLLHATCRLKLSKTWALADAAGASHRAALSHCRVEAQQVPRTHPCHTNGFHTTACRAKMHN